jgi:hypothetical protein
MGSRRYSATELTSLGPSGQIEDIDLIRESGRSIIAAKDAEIARLNLEIDEAQRLLDEGHQSGIDNKYQINDEIAQMEHELERITARGQDQLELLRQQYERELSDVNARNAREIVKLRATIERAQRDQEDLTRMANRARDLRAGPRDQHGRHDQSDDRHHSDDDLAQPDDARHDRDDDRHEEEDVLPELDSKLDSAKTHLKELRADVARLEAELRKVTTDEQQKIAEHARAAEEMRTSKAEQAAVAELKEELRRETDEANDRLRKAKEKNHHLDRQLAAVRAQNAQKQTEQSTRKQKAKKGKKPSLNDVSTLDAQILRLTDENEDLRAILRELDKLAYDANR